VADLRDGEFEYHIRSADEQHERMARESELSVIDDEASGSSKEKR
jgi:hypothetical protein